MPPTLLLVRHAQALHNLTENYFLPDPALTDHGHEQCVALQRHLKQNLDTELGAHGLSVKDLKLIVVSPLRRTLQTAVEGLGWLIDGGVEVRLDAGWQGKKLPLCSRRSEERSDRRSVSVIGREFRRTGRFGGLVRFHRFHQIGDCLELVAARTGADGEHCEDRLWELRRAVRRLGLCTCGYAEPYLFTWWRLLVWTEMSAKATRSGNVGEHPIQTISEPV